MNLNKLFETQKQLDDRIVEEHGLEGKNLLDEKILALIVELGELANETRCFKFWSKKPASEKSVVLEEYVDGLHFILSIGNLLGHENTTIVELDTGFNLTEQFLLINESVHILRGYAHNGAGTADRYCILLSEFIDLGTLLGFTETDIIEAYYAKNEENHSRQERGY